MKELMILAGITESRQALELFQFAIFFRFTDIIKNQNAESFKTVFN